MLLALIQKKRQEVTNTVEDKNNYYTFSLADMTAELDNYLKYPVSALTT